MRNIKIKETYLLLLIVMGLISMAVYSTYALFTASTTINNVVGMTATLTTDSNILEYEMVTIEPRETKIIELTVKNSYTSSLYYGAWYEILSSDTDSLNIGLYTEKNSTASSGQIAASATKTLLVGISNSSTEEMMVNIGTVGSLTSNLNLASTRTLLPAGWNIPARVTLDRLGLPLTSGSAPNFTITAPFYEIVDQRMLLGEDLGSLTNVMISKNIRYIDNVYGEYIELIAPITVDKEDLSDYIGWYMCYDGDVRSCSNSEICRIEHVDNGQTVFGETGFNQSMYFGEPMGNLLLSSRYTFDSETGIFTLTSPTNINTNGAGTAITGYYFCMNQSNTCEAIARIDEMLYSDTVGVYYVGETSINSSEIVGTNVVLELTQLVLAINPGNDGIFPAEDDFGTSYYFRGDVENNYVHTQLPWSLYWKIVRINGDGTIRMIFDGYTAFEIGVPDNSRKIIDGRYNNELTDNSYAGYMFGYYNSSNYGTVHSNINDSSIKSLIDEWYEVEVVPELSPYVVDSIYCNDRSLASGTGIGSTTTMYGAYNRLSSNRTPSLMCSQLNDKFTVSTNIGNGKLKFPIGLLTADEVSMAGGVAGQGNGANYLYTGFDYFSMSPGAFMTGMTMYGVNTYGELTLFPANSLLGVKPVITISADAITSGSGTLADPFIVG